MIVTLVNRLLHLIETLGYRGIGLGMFLESFFAPIPSELLAPFAGFLAAQGKMNFGLLVVICAVASYLGTLPFYFLGYRGHRSKIEGFVEKRGKYFFITKEDVQVGFDRFTKYGSSFVFFGRLIPMIRTVVSFPAGAVRMPFLSFSILTIAGSAIWSTFLLGAGWYLGEYRENVSVYLSQYEHIIIGICVLVVVIFIGYRRYHSFVKGSKT